ncbi:MAG: cation-translocating P-type ATPase, partial [Chitinophagaceae bacterium]
MPSVAETLSSVTGLSSESISGLQKKYGKNEYRKQRRSALWIFLSNLFKEPLLLLLIISGCLYFILGQTPEGIMMLVAIVLVAAIGFFQEARSAKAIKALKNMISVEVSVIRDGVRITIHSRELVPGDIMLLEEGNKVPADGRILEAHDLTVNEAILTGESLPVTKSADPEYREICQGTLINSGSCLAMVTATGNNTQLVKIGRLVDEYAASKTVLQTQ